MREARYLNVERRRIARLLRKKARENRVNLWRMVADLIEKPKRSRVAVNVGRINRYTGNNDIVVVPGKTLSTGSLNHPVTVASLTFSAKAREKIEKVGGRCLRLEDLTELNPKGSNIKILA